MPRQLAFLDDTKPDFTFETRMGGRVAGVDEAGRGPLAGPVVAAAVILSPASIPEGLNDSKKLPRQKREDLFVQISETAAVGLGQASVQEIDALNILEAAMLAMRRAVKALGVTPDGCLVDGRTDPGLGLPTRCLIRGDGTSLSIAAASIIAKVTRDRIMAELAKEFPAYGWEKNAGYGVPRHLSALEKKGPSPHHRQTFAPIRKLKRQEKTPVL